MFYESVQLSRPSLFCYCLEYYSTIKKLFILSSARFTTRPVVPDLPLGLWPDLPRATGKKELQSLVK